ncbi:MAG: aldehyde dehydrogenase family protein [Bdellovibrionia bacterium]
MDLNFKDLQSNAHLQRRSSYQERIALLQKLEEAIEAHVDLFCEALAKDFHKPRFESLLTEIYPLFTEIKHAKKELKKWMRPQKVATPLALFGTSSRIQYQAKGCVLIIAPWNYPLQLAIAPLIPAIAAGNTVVIKPSELAPNTAQAIHQVLKKTFAPNLVEVVLGGINETTELLKLPFDHIFFTGSTQVGKVVMEAAAKNLSSVTLELGGKSPTIILPDCDLKDAAKKITWGKFINAGQTCVAPDYIFVHESQKQNFINELKNSFQEKYTQLDTDLAHIISPRHKARLDKLSADAEQNGAQIQILSANSSGEKFFAPRVVSGVNQSLQLMKEEIFGPILPIMTYSNIQEAVDFVNKNERPLALYIFGKDKNSINSILESTVSGGACVNDTVIHLANHHLPFGGIGPSGLGSYHGYFGFKAFSHEKAVLIQSSWNKSMQLFYPPYNGFKQKILDLLLKFKI